MTVGSILVHDFDEASLFTIKVLTSKTLLTTPPKVDSDFTN